MNNANLSPKETNDLGDKYFFGNGVPRNIELAYTYYKQTADEGNPVGLFNVGRYFLEKQEYKQSIAYLQKSLASGYSKAYLLLAEMALKGKGMFRSKKKAFRYTMDGAKLNDTDAFNQLASYYIKGIGCEKDLRKARDYYQKSADLKNPEGMYRLALMILDTVKGKRNPEEAIKWLDEAVEANHQGAMDALYSLYDKPHPYFKKRSQAFRDEMKFFYLEKKAKTGDENALEKVAQDYLEGTMITPENPEKAAYYFRLLQSRNNVIGHYGYGVCLIKGLGINKNVESGKAELLKAANEGNVKAMIALGDACRQQNYQDIDMEEAKRWYYEAAKQNDPEALVNLSLLHYRKDITNSSDELAFKYMESALKKGSPKAHYWLGIYYEKGVGTIINITKAIKHYQKALDAGVSATAFKYATCLYDCASSKPKQDQKMYAKSLDLFREYVKYPQHLESNVAMACYQIAMMYKEGLGTEKSSRRSRYWFELAASGGNGSAMLEMYFILRASEIVPAMKWLEKSANDAKEPAALYELGILYLNGAEGIRTDLARARQYLEIAARSGYKPALDRLKML